MMSEYREITEQQQLADEEEPEDGVPIVLVTGASGYVATHIIQQLQQQGRFRVRGTVRSLKDQAKVQPLRHLVPDVGCFSSQNVECRFSIDAQYPLRLVEADLLRPETWQLAVKRCVYVFHVASPFPFKPPKNDDEVIRPAVEGTLNVLRACSEAGTVKRVALTSSVAAVSSGMSGNPGNPPDYVYTEKDWSHEPYCSPYEKSKFRAEKAAWDFMKKLEEDKQFELTVLNPGFIQGPFLTKSFGSSAELGIVFLNNKVPLVDLTFGFVDVRDVAAAHIAAIEKDDAAGERHILVSTNVHIQQVASLVDTEFKPQGYKVPQKVLGKAATWTDPVLRSMYMDLGKSIKYSNERMRSVLGVEPRAFKDTMHDTCYNLIDLGIVKKTPGYLGHPSTRPLPPRIEAAVEEEANERLTNRGETPGAEVVRNSQPLNGYSSWQQEQEFQSQQREQDLQAQLTESQQTEQDLRTQLQWSQQEKQDLQAQVIQSQQTEQDLQTRLWQTEQDLQRQLQQREHLQRQLQLATQAMESLRLESHSHASSRELEFWNVPRTDIQLASEIDRGGWGTVVKGTFQGRAVAVKQLHPTILSKDNVLRLRREVRMMAQVRHPNLLLFIAAVFDGEVDKLRSPPLIVMELLDTDLRKAYKTNLILSRDRIPIFRDIAFALNYLHNCREPIIHRDLSAPNVLLEALANNRWKAKVSDFGSANLVKFAQTAAEGAIIYSAPETFPDEVRDPSVPTEQTPKIDVYSYGVLLCEVITCRLPTQFKQMKAEVEQSWPFMHSLITSCTNRYPGNRPTMDQVLNELRKLP